MDPFPAITPALGRCSDGIRDWGSITLFGQAVNALGNSIINLRNMLVVCEYATNLPRLARLYIIWVSGGIRSFLPGLYVCTLLLPSYYSTRKLTQRLYFMKGAGSVTY